MPTLVLQLSNIKKGVANPMKETNHLVKNKTQKVIPQLVFPIEDIQLFFDKSNDMITVE